MSAHHSADSSSPVNPETGRLYDWMVLAMRGMRRNEAIVWMTLVHFSANNRCSVTQEKIAEACQISVQAAMHGVRLLVDRGVVVVVHHSDGSTSYNMIDRSCR